MIRKLTSVITGEEFPNVEIVSYDDLPRGCDFVTSLVDEHDYERYVVYQNCVDHMYYAHIEEVDPF